MSPNQHHSPKEDPRDPPPILTSWGRLYLLVLGALCASVLLLYALGKAFS